MIKININIKYEGYIKRQLKQVEQFKKLETKRIPEMIDYNVSDGMGFISPDMSRKWAKFLGEGDLEKIKPAYYSYQLKKQEAENAKKAKEKVIEKITTQLNQMGYSIKSHYDDNNIVEKILNLVGILT